MYRSYSAAEDFPSPEQVDNAALRLGAATQKWGAVGEIVTLRVAPGLLQVKTSAASAVSSKRVPSGRSAVKGISRRSRNRFWTTMAKINWSSAIEAGETLALVTLTYPRSWRVVCGSPKQLADQLDALVKRFERQTRAKFRAVWVREFQRRRAPHLHLVLIWPCSLRTTWLASAWYEVVGSGDERHLSRGIKVDLFESVDSEALRKVSIYLMKQAEGMASCPFPPADWVNPSGGVGRCWGKRGLKFCVSEVSVPVSTLIEILRVLRRLYRSRSGTTKVRVKRHVRSTGEVTFRFVCRRKRIRSLKDSSSGFSFYADDGPWLAMQLARMLELQNPQPWPRGARRPLP